MYEGWACYPDKDLEPFLKTEKKVNIGQKTNKN